MYQHRKTEAVHSQLSSSTKTRVAQALQSSLQSLLRATHRPKFLYSFMWLVLVHGHIDLLHASIAALGACESVVAGTCGLCTWAAAGGTGGTCGTGVGACAVLAACGTVDTAGGRAVGTSGIDDTGTEAAGSVCAALDLEH